MQLTLSPNADVPVYKRIAQAVRDQIQAGQLSPGDKITSEPKLAALLGYNCLTISQAYGELVGQGIIYQKRGAGTFISHDAPQRLRSKQGHPVNKLMMLIGAKSLSECLSATKFIVSDLMEGLSQLLPEAVGHVTFLDQLTPAAADSLQPGDALVITYDHDLPVQLLSQLLARQVRVIHAWGQSERLGVPRVNYDHHQSVAVAVEHLVKCGYQRIGFLGRLSYPVDLPVFKLEVFREEMKRHGLAVDERDVIQASPLPGKAFMAMQKRLRQGDLPEALFIDTDRKAMEAIAALQDAGVRIPEDMGIVSFDNLPETASFQPPLTTVMTRRREIGLQTARLLLSWEPGGPVPADVTLPAQLMIRQSTQPLPRASASRKNKPSTSKARKTRGSESRRQKRTVRSSATSLTK